MFSDSCGGAIGWGKDEKPGRGFQQTNTFSFRFDDNRRNLGAMLTELCEAAGLNRSLVSQCWARALPR